MRPHPVYFQTQPKLPLLYRGRGNCKLYYVNTVFAKFRQRRFNAKTAHGKPSRDCRLRIPGARLRVRRASRRRIGNGCSSRVVVAGHGAAAAARPVIEPPGAPTVPLASARDLWTRHVWKRCTHPTCQMLGEVALQKSSSWHF